MRDRYDADTTVSKALPAANANTNSASIDLGNLPDSALEHIEAVVAIPATPDLEAGTDITVKLQDSDDDSSFADIVGLGSQIVTGSAESTGGPATVLRWALQPDSLRQYLSANVAVENGGGDNTGVDFEFKLGY